MTCKHKNVIWSKTSHMTCNHRYVIQSQNQSHNMQPQECYTITKPVTWICNHRNVIQSHDMQSQVCYTVTNQSQNMQLQLSSAITKPVTRHAVTSMFYSHKSSHKTRHTLSNKNLLFFSIFCLCFVRDAYCRSCCFTKVIFSVMYF